MIASCSRCGHRWYLPRPCCPSCGSEQTATHPAEGTATLAAVTVVHRSATGEQGPFGIALADLDAGPGNRGVRLMARCDPAARPGDRGRIRLRNPAQAAGPGERGPEPLGAAGGAADGRMEASAGEDPAADMIPFFDSEAP